MVDIWVGTYLDSFSELNIFLLFFPIRKLSAPVPVNNLNIIDCQPCLRRWIDSDCGGGGGGQSNSEWHQTISAGRLKGQGKKGLTLNIYFFVGHLNSCTGWNLTNYYIADFILSHSLHLVSDIFLRKSILTEGIIIMIIACLISLISIGRRRPFWFAWRH